LFGGFSIGKGRKIDAEVIGGQPEVFGLADAAGFEE
jgi:hypothetical protein